MNDDRRRAFEAMERRHKREREKMEKEYALREKLPGVPKSVHPFPQEAYITYETATLQEGLDALALFEPLDVDARQSGCLSVAPPDRQEKNYANIEPQWACEDCIEVVSEGSEGRGELELILHSCLGRVCAKAPLLSGWTGMHRLHARKEIDRDSRGRYLGIRLVHSALKDYAAQFVSWSSGSMESWRVSYYFEGLDKLKAALDDLGLLEEA